MNETELATVFANALENAIHACEAVPEESRLLEITVSPRKNHGFGTRSIVAFCSKNNAEYEFKADPNYFHLRISFCKM